MKTLVSDLYEMFSLGTSSDFEIHIQDRTIKAHKSVLITRNSYFRCLLESNMVEAQENALKVDEDYDSFKVSIFIILLVFNYHIILQKQVFIYFSSFIFI